jgi:hypothetical protein
MNKLNKKNGFIKYFTRLRQANINYPLSIDYHPLSKYYFSSGKMGLVMRRMLEPS